MRSGCSERTRRAARSSPRSRSAEHRRYTQRRSQSWPETVRNEPERTSDHSSFSTPRPHRVTPSAPNGSVIVHVFGRTDVGRTREHNEDAFVVADLTRGNATLQPEVRTHEVGDRGTLFMVADGMGGAAAGEIASAMAIEVVLREVTDAVS